MNGVSSSSFTAAYHTILSTDGGERIFREFGLDVGKRYVSPFRPDATRKNFSVFRSPNGHIGFKDFASGNGGLFTALLYGFGYTTFEAQIRFAASVYGITVKEPKVSGHSPLVIRHSSEVRSHSSFAIGHSSSGYRKQSTNDQVTKHQVTNDQSTNDQVTKHRRRYRVTALELADFTTVELQTLARVSSGLITPELLASYGIRALRSYTDEGVSDKGFAYGGEHEARFTLVVPSANGNYYAYCYFGAEKHSPFPSQSKNFHLKLGEYTAEVKFALGLAELRPNEPAYLVEGIKDCLILLAKGYNAFTLGGVQHRLHLSVVKRLQENGNSLNIVFDTDFAGISAAQKLASTLKTQHSTLNTQHFILPRLERQETKDAPKPAKNDLADYVCQYGFDDELTNVLVSPAPLRSITLTKASLQIPAWQLSVQSKIMEDVRTLKALTNLAASASRLVLRAPTGCGKTYTVLRHIAPEHYKRTGGVTVLAVPTVAMAEQIKNEYHDLKPIVITGNESDLHRLYADEPLDTCIIISVYDSASRLLDIISERNTLLVVDEMHKLVSDYNYRTSAVRIMLCLIKQAHRVLALSATPELLFHEAPLSFTYCTIKVEQERPLHVHTRTYDKRDAAVLATIRDILHRHPSTTILLNVNSKKLLRRTKILLMKSGLPESAVDIVTRDTMDTSPEYRAATEQSRFTRPVILSTNVLDCGVNILNEGRAHVIMVDEKNEDTVIQVANRFRKAEIIDVTLLYAKNKGNKEQETNDQATNVPMTNDQETNDQETNAPMTNDQCTNDHSPIFNEKYHFLQAQFSAQMTAEAFNHAAGRNVSAECGTHRLGRKSNATLSDSMIHFEHRHHRWATDECAIMNRIHTLRLAMKTIEDVIKALEAYGFVHVVDKPLTDMSPLAPEIIAEVREEMRQEEREREETILQMLETKTTYFLAALNTFSRSKALKSALPRICPASLMPLVKQHPETEAIIAQHAELLRELRTETMVRYYTEARDLGFEHAEAIHLVRQNSDPRKWASFTDRLPIKQREAISLNGLTESVLSKHDREKLRREEEIRRMIANTAQQGCTITGSNGVPRHIPNALRTKKEIAERANAYTGIMFRMSQQQAGEMVNALFYVHYVRERVKTDHGTRFSGHYAFENDGTELRRKTLAEFVSEYGVDGAKYERLFMEQVREEAQRYEEAQERALRYETVE